MQVKFLTPARADVREIVSYYNDQREGLGSEFTLELRQTLMCKALPASVVTAFNESSTL